MHSNISHPLLRAVCQKNDELFFSWQIVEPGINVASYKGYECPGFEFIEQE